MVDGLEADGVAGAGLRCQCCRWLIEGRRLAESSGNNAAPYTSTIVFLVRKGNPKQIVDWDEPVRQGCRHRHPQSDLRRGTLELSGRLRGYALKKSRKRGCQFVGDPVQEREGVDSGARGATTSFNTERGLGDVLLAWENEAAGARISRGPATSSSWCPRSPSSWRNRGLRWWDKVARKHGYRGGRQGPFDYLYPTRGSILSPSTTTPEQPGDPQGDIGSSSCSWRSYRRAIQRDWEKAQKKHFAQGGLFDLIYQPGG